MSNRIQKSSQKASDLAYICGSCGKYLRDKHSLTLHRLAKHSSEFYSCPNCDEHFSLKSDFNKHLMRVHGEIKPKCEECKLTFANEHTYKGHVNSYHGTFPCSYSGCRHKLDTLVNLNKHIEKSHVLKFPCQICELEFRHKNSLTEHLESVHADYSCRCLVEGCDSKFTHPRTLRAHVLRVHEIKHHPETVCKLCGHDFKGCMGSLNRHMRTVHWLESFKTKFGKPKKDGENEDDLESLISPTKLSTRRSV